MPENPIKDSPASPPADDSQKPQSPTKKTLAQYIAQGIREILSVTFWLYALTKIFVFDLDLYIVSQHFPETAWLINYKFFILIGVLAATWAVTKSQNILAWSAYILFYPIIVIFWKVPFFIFTMKSWNLAFAVINAVISFFRSFKYNFITSALLLCSFAILGASSNLYALYIAVASVVTILLTIYIHRFISTFKPSSIFQAYTKIFSGIRKHGTTSFALDSALKGIPIARYDQSQLTKWSTNLQLSVLFNRVCLFSAKKLRDYQNSGFNLASGVLTTLILILITVLGFAFTNYGIYKIDSHFFTAPATPSFFVFIYYSFNNLFFNQIPEIVPTSPISQSLSMVENLFAFLLGAIFLSIVLPIRNQRYSEELNQTISNIREQGDSMEHFIRDEYNISTIEDALMELQRAKANMVTVLYQISDGLKDE